MDEIVRDDIMVSELPSFHHTPGSRRQRTFCAYSA